MRRGASRVTSSGCCEHRDWLLAWASRGFTLRGLVAELADRGVKVDDRQVWELAKAEVLSLEYSALPAEQLRPGVAELLKQWRRYPARLDAGRLVFFDGLMGWTASAAASVCQGWSRHGPLAGGARDLIRRQVWAA